MLGGSQSWLEEGGYINDLNKQTNIDKAIQK